MSYAFDEDYNHPAARLVRYIARAFFDDLSIVILDKLLEVYEVKESDLANMLHVPQKDVIKALGNLKSYHVVGSFAGATNVTYVTKDQVTGQTRNIIKSAVKKGGNMWFIDFKVFHDATKLRMHYMRELCQKRSEVETRYACTNSNCGLEYDEMELMNITDMNTGMVNCSRCGSEVDLISSTTDGEDDESPIKKFERQMKRIIDCLDEMKTMVIPSDMVARRKASSILTREEANQEKYERERQMQREQTMGGHSAGGSKQSRPALGGLGSTGHGGQLNQGFRTGNHQASADGRTIIVREDEEESEDEYADVGTPKETRDSSSTFGPLPDFLLADSHINRQEEEERRLLQEQAQQRKRQEQIFEQTYNTLLHGHTPSGESASPAEVVEEEEAPVESEQNQENNGAEIVYVLVSGTSIPIDHITPAEISNMTDEEYSDYCSKRQTLGLDDEWL